MNPVPCVALIIQNPKGEVLLLLRDNNPEISFPNQWTLIGGGIDDGETPEMAAYRELFEETGLELELSFWKRYNRLSPKGSVDQFVYYGQIDNPSPKIIIGEGQDIRLWKPEEIGQLKIAYEFDSLLEEYFSWRSNQNLDAFHALGS